MERELDNKSNRYVVAVKNDGTNIGHLPRIISWASSLSFPEKRKFYKLLCYRTQKIFCRFIARRT